MNIDSISSALIESLVKQDAVFIHGLGCFKTELQPSVISDNGYTISPPYKKLSFSSEKNGTAVDFATFYASTQGISEEEAHKIIDEFANFICDNLKIEGTAEIPLLGKFRAIPDGGIIFIVDRCADLNPEGFGLENISLRNRTMVNSMDTTALTPQKSESTKSDNDQTISSKEEATSNTRLESQKEENAPNDSSKPEKIKETSWKATKKKVSLGKTLLILFIIALVLLLAFLLMARFYPDLIDRILYTPEQLEQIKSRGI